MSKFRRRLMMNNVETEEAVPTFYNYLVFDGQSQINTDINLPTDGAINVYVKNGTSSVRNQGYFTVRNASNNNVVFIYAYASGTNVVYRGAYGTTSYSNTGGINWANHKNSYFWITPKAFGAGDSRKTFTKGSQVPSSGIIFGYQATNRFIGSMGIVYIYDNSAENVTTLTGLNSITPVYTLRPCEYKGKCGFWCVETNKFYGNSLSTGTLTVSD